MHYHKKLASKSECSEFKTQTEHLFINSLYGTYHAIRKKHLPRYLGEFCFRFNHRFKPEDKIPALLRASVCAPPMPEKLLKLAESRW
ncbi:transposase [Vibrio alfacsensis]|uniref:transposase n=1 Tax=Vibrio TaxID=662 RepID=UPI004069651B